MNNKRLLNTIQSIPIKLRIYRAVRSVLVWFIFAAIINLLLSYVLYTPKSFNMNKENMNLVKEIESLEWEMNHISNNTEKLKFRYKNVYKTLFGLSEKLPFERIPEISDEKYSNIRDDRYKKVIREAYRSQDKLIHELNTLSNSLDTISKLALHKNEMLKSLPIISPIHKKNIRRISDKFGLRFHPIKKRKIMHRGLDIACAINTPIYAPSDGVVKIVQTDYGYGKLIIIDHGFGYITKYAHLNKYEVKVGDTVRRGELIALSGNTGVSTGPHLHYEVLFNKKHVDPINYISNDMTNEEFAKILESAKTDTSKPIDNYDIQLYED